MDVYTCLISANAAANTNSIHTKMTHPHSSNLNHPTIHTDTHLVGVMAKGDIMNSGGYKDQKQS